MKKILFILLLTPLFSFAQLLAGKNIIKANLSSLAFNNYHATYEHCFTKRVSLSVSYRFMSKQNVPLQDAVKNYFNDPNLDLGNFKLGNNAITPELRLYAGKGKGRGFYMALYGRFANFDFTLPLKYKSSPTTTNTANFEGVIKSSNVGLMFGIQHNLAKALVIDFWILGGHYGNSTGNLIANKFDHTLNSYEQTELQNSINSFNASPFKIKGTVATDGKSATIESTGPWAGVRGAGLSLGFRF